MTHKPFTPRTAILVLSLVAGSALAQSAGTTATPVSTSAAPAAKGDPRAAIVKKIDGLKLEDVRMTPVTGIYEITRGWEVRYTSIAGRYVILAT